MGAKLPPSATERSTHNLFELPVIRAKGFKVWLGRLATVGLLVTSTSAVQQVIDPVVAYADTVTTTYSDLGYPFNNAPCEFGTAGGGSCTNPAKGESTDKYDWYVDEDGDGQFGSASNRTGCGYVGASGECWDSGYEYRNCTDYVQWKEAQVGISVPNGWGNGGQWYDQPRKVAGALLVASAEEVEVGATVTSPDVDDQTLAAAGTPQGTPQVMVVAAVTGGPRRG